MKSDKPKNPITVELSRLLIVTAILGLASASQASIKKPKKVTPSKPSGHEIYAATEEEVDGLPPPRPLNQPPSPHAVTAPTTISKPATIKSAQNLAQPDGKRPSARPQMPGKVAAGVIATPLASPSPSPTPSASGNPILDGSEGTFDFVPSDQVQPLMRRLQLVEEIIRKHARAYDYRTFTIKDLEDILERLDTEAKAPAKPQNPAPEEAR